MIEVEEYTPACGSWNEYYESKRKSSKAVCIIMGAAAVAAGMVTCFGLCFMATLVG